MFSSRLSLALWRRRFKYRARKAAVSSGSGRTKWLVLKATAAQMVELREKQLGQLTKHFHIDEFACHDGTGYIEGLVKEQGLSVKDARGRAVQLAKYLEKVRAAHGNKPLHLNSVFRTKAYNKSIGGAKNSAHTRGFAADSTPPVGVSLERHREVCRAVFPSGVGFYPQANFVHGDFDPVLGRRDWVGP